MEGTDAQQTPLTRVDGAEIARRLGWFITWIAVTAVVVVTVVRYGFADAGADVGIVLVATGIGFFVLPDLAFFVAAGEPHAQGRLPRRTVPVYNALHRLWTAVILTVATGWLVSLSAEPSVVAVVGFVGGLSWIAHIAIDRALGFGLRNPDGSL